MLKFKYKDADAETKQEMLTEVISKYNVSGSDKSQVVQALAHCQALYDCSQDDFADNPAVKMVVRTVRNYKKEFEELYVECFNKYKQEPKPLDIEITIEEDVMENVYQNLLAKLSNPRTQVKDISAILTYFNISGTELRQYAQLRGASMRGFIRDNEKVLIPDEETVSLVKATLAESDYLYLGSEKTQGNTKKFMEMDLNDPFVRLELQMAGMLFYSYWNGSVNPQLIELAQTLRVLKLASGEKLDTTKATKDFEGMDGKPKAKKPLTDKLRTELVDIFGQEKGHEMYLQLLDAKAVVDAKTAIPLPRYEDVKTDYNKHLKLFPKLENMPLNVFLAKLDGDIDKQYKDKYQQFLTTEEEK